MLDTLIESFARAGLGTVQVKELRRHACELYNRCCREAEPEFHVRNEHGTHVQLPSWFTTDTLAAVDLTAAEPPDSGHRLPLRLFSAKA